MNYLLRIIDARIQRKRNLILLQKKKIKNSKENDIYSTHETFREIQERKYLFAGKESRTLSTRKCRGKLIYTVCINTD